MSDSITERCHTHCSEWRVTHDNTLMKRTTHIRLVAHMYAYVPRYVCVHGSDTCVDDGDDDDAIMMTVEI